MSRDSEERQVRLKIFLVEEKRKLWNELRVELFDTLGEGLHSQHDIPADLAERSVLSLLEDTGLAVIDIRREQLTRMEDALLKSERGVYGICEECGNEIDEARLRVAPYAPCCAGCQQQRELSAAARRATL